MTQAYEIDDERYGYELHTLNSDGELYDVLCANFADAAAAVCAAYFYMG